MNAQEYTNLLLNYDPKSEEQRKAFEKITYRYPYFQSAYAHYLKSLKAQEQYNFNLILKKTAILSPERNKLHFWLEENKTEDNKKENLRIVTKKVQPTASLADEKKQSVENTTPKESTKTTETVEQVKPNPPEKKKKAKKQEPKTMSFSEWVIYSSKGKIEAKPAKSSLEDKIKLIDTFLENQPKIPPVRQDQPKVDLSENNEFNKEELMTETLAKVYLQQKKYKKALYAYKILSLKYPEKNSFFADQIKRIKQLQQNS